MWDAELVEGRSSARDPAVRTVMFRSRVTGEVHAGNVRFTAGDLNDVSDKRLRAALNAARHANDSLTGTKPPDANDPGSHDPSRC
jgi:hypothetical protein